MSAYNNERSFINSHAIFELSAGERNLLRKQTKSGFNTVCRLLNEIGYYGVYNQKWDTLDHFETVVGGLSWCIGYIHPEYTRDIVYTSGMSLQKKLEVSEKLIVCLKEMKYPVHLWPQQIQGLDYRAIEDLLLWLKVKITDVRSSVPAYDLLAAQQVFEDEFAFDLSDRPAKETAWFSTRKQSLSPPAVSLGFHPTSTSHSIFCDCNPHTIHTFHDYLQHQTYLEGFTYNDDYFRNADFTDEITSTTSTSLPTISAIGIENGSPYEGGESTLLSNDVIQLLHMRELRVHDIVQLKKKEERRIRQVNELKKQFSGLQESYRHAEDSVQALAAREANEENAAKLQNLKSLLQLLETLTLQLSREKQSYQEELALLQHQVNDKEQMVEWGKQQYELALEISKKVDTSLNTVLSVFRGVNLDILQARCCLEKIPSKPELLFFEKQMKEFMDGILEGSAQLSQCYDMINNLTDNYHTQHVHHQFLQSLASVMKGKRSDINHMSQLLVEQMNEVTKQLTLLIQQYNLELKKRNRALQELSVNQQDVLEKKRLHGTMLQTLRQECDNNTELMKRLRQLQSRL